MKERIQHSLVLLIGLLVIVGGISLFLNNASYNPDFSVMDAISGATKKRIVRKKKAGQIMHGNTRRKRLHYPEKTMQKKRSERQEIHTRYWKIQHLLQMRKISCF